jgi:hypothetical protein
MSKESGSCIITARDLVYEGMKYSPRVSINFIVYNLLKSKGAPIVGTLKLELNRDYSWECYYDYESCGMYYTWSK